jgi:hypothetical protein
MQEEKRAEKEANRKEEVSDEGAGEVGEMNGGTTYSVSPVLSPPRPRPRPRPCPRPHACPCPPSPSPSLHPHPRP